MWVHYQQFNQDCDFSGDTDLYEIYTDRPKESYTGTFPILLVFLTRLNYEIIFNDIVAESAKRQLFFVCRRYLGKNSTGNFV